MEDGDLSGSRSERSPALGGRPDGSTARMGRPSSARREFRDDRPYVRAAWLAVGTDPARCELRGVDLNDLWFDWMGSFVELDAGMAGLISAIWRMRR